MKKFLKIVLWIFKALVLLFVLFFLLILGTAWYQLYSARADSRELCAAVNGKSFDFFVAELSRGGYRQVLSSAEFHIVGEGGELLCEADFEGRSFSETRALSGEFACDPVAGKHLAEAVSPLQGQKARLVPLGQSLWSVDTGGFIYTRALCNVTLEEGEVVDAVTDLSDD